MKIIALIDGETDAVTQQELEAEKVFVQITAQKKTDANLSRDNILR